MLTYRKLCGVEHLGESSCHVLLPHRETAVDADCDTRQLNHHLSFKVDMNIRLVAEVDATDISQMPEAARKRDNCHYNSNEQRLSFDALHGGTS